jgi:polyisoprenoid-binding protein YceI
VDPIHTSAEFEVQHMHISTYRSRFTGVAGEVVLDDENPAASSIQAQIDVRSLAVPGGRFQEIMLGADFFQAEQHPQLVFKSTQVQRTSSSHWRAEGTLSIRGIEKPFTLEIEGIGEANQPFNKVPMRAFRATGVLDRTAYGITWQAALDTGAAYLGEKVTVTLNVELLAA